jgi:2-polyprenyl-3-methyl-5-hydroxy-6-metoxy-1,4-benzoquinol methylase
MIFETRWDFIRSYVENKKVLDIGPAELVGTINREKLDRWIHNKIAKVAKRLIGIDKNPEQVRILADMGYNIRIGDAEQFELGEQFDAVVAGELIEHLSNPGRFLDCVRKHLVEGGKLLLTTPNRYSILSLFSVIKSGKVFFYKKPIDKHVLYFDSDSLSSLLKRHGFINIKINYCKWVGSPNSAGYVNRWLIKFAKKFRPVLLPVLLAVASKTEKC